MSTSRRIATLRAISQGAGARIGSAVFVHIDHELQELGHVARVHPEKRTLLLQVLHACRALETALKEMIQSHGVEPANSLNALFTQLTNIPYGTPGTCLTEMPAGLSAPSALLAIDSCTRLTPFLDQQEKLKIFSAKSRLVLYWL